MREVGGGTKDASTACIRISYMAGIHTLCPRARSTQGQNAL